LVLAGEDIIPTTPITIRGMVGEEAIGEADVITLL